MKETDPGKDGCSCRMHTSHGEVPCRWCEGLSETETSILDVHGYDVLIWLQTNYLIYEGTWGDDIMEEEQGLLIALAKKTIAEKRGNFIKKRVDAHLDIVPRMDEINRMHNQMVEALTNIYGKSVLTRPIASGQTAVSADIKHTSAFDEARRKAEKRRRLANAYGGLPSTNGKVIPLRSK